MGIPANGPVLASGDATATFSPPPGCGACCGKTAADTLQGTLGVTGDDGSCDGCDSRVEALPWNPEQPTPFGDGAWCNSFSCGADLLITVCVRCDGDGVQQLHTYVSCGAGSADNGWIPFDAVSCSPLSWSKDGITFATCTGCTFSMLIEE